MTDLMSVALQQARPVERAMESLVASGASGTSYQPTLDVGRAPVNIPSGRLVAALADAKYPYAATQKFRSNVLWEETVEVLSKTGTISFRARETDAWGDTDHALLLEPSKGDGVIVVECNQGYGRWTVSISATSMEVAERYMEAMARLLPHPPPPPPEPPRDFSEVRIAFWMQDPMSGYADSMSRWITTTKWSDVAANYPGELNPKLAELMAMTDPGSAGKLILFDGPPGTGKTRAILTLISEWRDWCSASVVTDSDQFFGSATYLNSIIFNSEGMGRWLLIVVEDGDEFINVDGRETKGQAIARLLNLNDGIVGQGLKLLTLMSTNVQAEKLNPALVRPGRCLSTLHFGGFSEADAIAWLQAKGIAEPVLPEIAEDADGWSLASLYKTLADFTAATEEAVEAAAEDESGD